MRRVPMMRPNPHLSNPIYERLMRTRPRIGDQEYDIGQVIDFAYHHDHDSPAMFEGKVRVTSWDPATETWSSAAPIARPRNYHSTALLLPDGRVMVSGGGHSQNNVGPGQFSAEFYTPSYLLIPIVELADAE